MKSVHKIKGIMALATALVMAIGATPVYAAAPQFADIAGHWSEKYVEALAEKGIVSGMGDGLFHPDDLVTTSEFVTMVIRSSVGDVAPIDSNWASGYMDKALTDKVITQTDFTDADRPIQRRIAATIAHKALLKYLNETDATDVTAANKLSDLNSCPPCAPHIAQLYVKGIVAGLPNGTYNGFGQLTRAEAAVIIMRMIDPSLRAPVTAAADPLAAHKDDALYMANIDPVSIDNPYIVATYDEVIQRLTKGTGVVVFGFPECPRCKNVLPTLETVFRQKGLDKQPGLAGKIYYYNILADRTANNERYKTLVSLTKNFLTQDANGNPRIYSPDVFFVANGVIVGNHLDTVPSLTDPKQRLNAMQTAELSGIYSDLIAKMQDACGC